MNSHTQKLLASITILGALALPLALALEEESCGAAALPIAQDVLSVAQIGCVLSSTLTDSKALADACAVAGPLIPVIEKLVAEREAAKKSGVTWQGLSDAGTPDASRDAR